MSSPRIKNGSHRRTDKQAKGSSPRRLPRWALALLLSLAALAVVLNVAWWLWAPKILPLPAIPTGELEPEVAAIVEAARQQVERDNYSAAAWGDLGAALRAHDLGPQANICFRNAQSLDPSDYRWPYLLGVSLTGTDADASLANLRRAAELCGNRSHVHLRLAEMLLDRGLTADAARVVDHVFSFAPSEPRAQLARARLLFMEGKFADSRPWAEKSADRAPDKRAPHLLLAQIYRRLGDEAGQNREMDLLQSIPDGITPWEDPDLEVLFGLRQDRMWQLRNAEQLAMSGQVAQAADTFAELAQGDSHSAAATLKLAHTLFQQRKYSEAERVLREQLQLQRDDERLHFELGVACFLQGNYEPAVQEFRQATRLKPDHVNAHYNLGHALLKIDRTSEALEAFAAAVALSPGHSQARANLAELLLQAGKEEEAEQHLDVAARLNPDDPKVRDLKRRLELRAP